MCTDTEITVLGQLKTEVYWNISNSLSKDKTILQWLQITCRASWASNKVRFGRYLPKKRVEGWEDDTRLRCGDGCHALQGLLFTCFTVVCSRSSFSKRNWECPILEHHVVFQVLTLDSDAAFEWKKWETQHNFSLQLGCKVEGYPISFLCYVSSA